MPQAGWSDQEIEIRMGGLLRWGITMASMLMLVGAVVYLPGIWSAPAEYSRFRPAAPIQWTLQGHSLFRFGILLLIATPVARVVFAAYAFYRQRDMQYLWISFGVLALLALGLSGRL
jgi:uncharacterized membrane protein